MTETRTHASRSARATPTMQYAVDYLAYVGAMSAAVAIAIGAMFFAGQQTVHWLDRALEPQFLERGIDRRTVDDPNIPMKRALAFVPTGTVLITQAE